MKKLQTKIDEISALLSVKTGKYKFLAEKEILPCDQ